MSPKSRAKRKAKKAGRRSIEVCKQQRRSLQCSESTATAVVSLAPPLPGDQELEASSSVTVSASASTEELPSPSGPPIHTASTVESLNLEEDETSPSFEEDLPSVEATDSVQTNTKTSQEIMGGRKFVEEWLQVLGKDDMKSVAIFLCYRLVSIFPFTETKAAEYAAQMINHRTVRRWRSSLIENDGVLPESKHGKHQRTSVWIDEDLNEKATEYARSNDAVKGQILTFIDFCCWVNDSLLPNSTLEPGFPRKVCLETARKWLHQLGFEV